jgi:tyrosine-protein phosphatase YwqE
VFAKNPLVNEVAQRGKYYDIRCKNLISVMPHLERDSLLQRNHPLLDVAVDELAAGSEQ